MHKAYVALTDFFFKSLAREEVTEIPNWGRELSVIDMLKGSDGHVYKGRFKQVCGNRCTKPLMFVYMQVYMYMQLMHDIWCHQLSWQRPHERCYGETLIGMWARHFTLTDPGNTGG